MVMGAYWNPDELTKYLTSDLRQRKAPIIEANEIFLVN